jgi:hypothetical protein
MPPPRSVYPWDRMKVGNSFVVESKSNAKRLCDQANKTRAPKRFKARSVHGVKWIWRVK